VDNFWLEDVKTEHLIFLLSISRIIRQSDAASPGNDEANKDIQKELEDRGKIGHYDKDTRNTAVKTWLKAKKREFRKREEHPGNGYSEV
jgi:hypothetical protein